MVNATRELNLQLKDLESDERQKVLAAVPPLLVLNHEKKMVIILMFNF